MQKIAILWVLEFLNRTLRKNHENWYTMKIKPSTVIDEEAALFEATTECKC